MFNANMLGSVVGLALLVSAVYHTGYRSGFDKAENNFLEQNQDDLQLLFLESEELQDDIAILDNQYVISKNQLESKIELLQDEINRYDENANNSSCIGIDASWVRMHNDAAALSTDSTPTTPGLVDDTTGGIDHIRIIRVIADNYALCARHKEQLEALQDYVKLLLAP